MESTSDYWKPAFYLLEATGLETWLVNAKDVKHLPGRPKTDRLDAVWLCTVAERQMIRPSFVPPPLIRQLRDLTRYRRDLVATRTAEKQRVEKLLEDACLKLSVVASDIFGVSGRAMMAALIAGQRDPGVLAGMARTSMRRKIPQLTEALTGYFTDHHAFLLATMLARIDGVTTDIERVEARIEELVTPFAAVVDRLDEITGIGRAAAHVIIAEIGVDMTRFPTPGHLCSWARFAPGVSESAGRRKPAGTGHGNRYLAQVLGEAASRPATPTPSWANVTAGSLDAAARTRPSSRSAGPCWSSSGISSPTPTPPSRTSAPSSIHATPAPNARSATTSVN